MLLYIHLGSSGGGVIARDSCTSCRSMCFCRSMSSWVCFTILSWREPRETIATPKGELEKRSKGFWAKGIPFEIEQSHGNVAKSGKHPALRTGIETTSTMAQRSENPPKPPASCYSIHIWYFYVSSLKFVKNEIIIKYPTHEFCREYPLHGITPKFVTSQMVLLTTHPLNVFITQIGPPAPSVDVRQKDPSSALAHVTGGLEWNSCFLFDDWLL